LNKTQQQVAQPHHKPQENLQMCCTQWQNCYSWVCVQKGGTEVDHLKFGTETLLLFFYGATAWGEPWPPLQYVSKPLDPLLYLSIRLFPSFSDL
jgi:hypothetical protein